MASIHSVDLNKRSQFAYSVIFLYNFVIIFIQLHLGRQGSALIYLHTYVNVATIQLVACSDAPIPLFSNRSDTDTF